MNKAYDDILKQLKRYEKKYGKFEFLVSLEIFFQKHVH